MKVKIKIVKSYMFPGHSSGVVFHEDKQLNQYKHLFTSPLCKRIGQAKQHCRDWIRDNITNKNTD